MRRVLTTVMVLSLLLPTVTAYDICCHLFTMTDRMLDFNTLSIRHEQKWKEAGYIPKVYTEMMDRPNRFVVISVDDKTAYYFLNSPNNYTKCYDCSRINHETNTISTKEEDRMHWLSNYVKISQHDYVICQTQLENTNWTTVYIAAAIIIVLLILFGSTAIVAWVCANVGQLK